MPAGRVILRAEGIEKYFGQAHVLRGVDLEVCERETVMIVGRSGSGKSTLLRLLNRLAEPDEGVIRFRGDEVHGLDVLELRRRACLVTQVPTPFPGTVEDNVRYGPGLLGRDAELARCLELAGLDASYAGRQAARLSVGEQQRVMLARALALEPEVLLLDESTAALDEDARAGVERTLAELGDRLEVSTVVVTHDREQARRVATRTVELRDGRVVVAA